MCQPEDTRLYLGPSRSAVLLEVFTVVRRHDDPGEIGLGELEVLADRRRCDVDDRGVEHDDEVGDRQQRQSEPAAGMERVGSAQRGTSAGGLKELDGIAGGIFEQNLAAAPPGDDLAPKAGPGRAQYRDLALEV